MRIRFTQDVIFETEGRRLGPRFEAGSVHDLRDDHARRWLRREVAVPDAAEASPTTVADIAGPEQVATSNQIPVEAGANGGSAVRRRSTAPDPANSKAADDPVPADRPEPGQQPVADDARRRPG